MELVYGELPPQEAAELRREIDACPQCAPELARLEEGRRLANMLPLEPLPSSAREAILAAAREAADPAVQPPKVAPLRRSAFWSTVAMAAIVLLVVLVGVSYSPEQEANELEQMVPGPPASLDRGQPEPVEAPSPGGTPSSPVDSAAQRSIPDQARESEMEGPAANVRAPADRHRARRARGRRIATGTERPRARSTEQRTATLAARGAAPSGVATAPTPAAASPADTAPLAPSAAGARARSTAPAPPTSEALDQGWESRNEERASPSLEDQTPIPTTETRAPPPEELLRLARSHRARGACAIAVSRYTELRRRYPADPRVPQALVEEADCRGRLGQLGQARTLLREAAGYPSTRTVARRELRRVETRLRARRGTASSPPQAAEPARVSE